MSAINSQVSHDCRIASGPSAPHLLTWLIHIDFNCFCSIRGQHLPNWVQLLCTDLCTQKPCLYRQAWTGLYFVTPVRRVINKAMHSLQGGEARKCDTGCLSQQIVTDRGEQAGGDFQFPVSGLARESANQSLGFQRRRS